VVHVLFFRAYSCEGVRKKTMNDPELDKRLLAAYPLHIVLMVKAAKKALDEGRAHIVDGVFMIDEPDRQLDAPRSRNVDS